MLLRQIPAKGAAVFEELRQIIDVDNRHHELRIKNRNLGLSRICFDKLCEWFSMERIKRAFSRRFVIQGPEILRDVPGHQEVSTADFGTRPGRSDIASER